MTTVFLNMYVTARIGLKRNKKGEKRTTALKGREERGEEKKKTDILFSFYIVEFWRVSGEKKRVFSDLRLKR